MITYTHSNFSKSFIFICLLISVIFSGCASQMVRSTQNEAQINNIDPWEGFNRSMYSFNKRLDKFILRPATNFYTAVTPNFIEQGITNFFSNLSEVGDMANNLLQGKVTDSVNVSSRFIVNSTFGVGGIFDFASFAGIDKRPEDFGQTLGKWGVPAGAYVVLPLFGPKTVRDTVAMPVDNRFDIMPEVIPHNRKTTAQVLRVLDTRKSLKNFEDMVFGDEYVFVRDAYLSRRQSKVNDGAINVRPSLDNKVFDEFD